MNNSKPKISIIVPMKNEEKNIRMCLESICNGIMQKTEYEIICIDNGSSDRTLDIAGEYADVVYKIPGKTISHLRNYGAEMAKGIYLAFVDADCVVDKYWLKNAFKYFGDEQIACFGATPEIPENATWIQKTWYLNKLARADVQSIDWLESMNLFVRKDVFVDMGGFNEKLETCEDVDFCYRIGQHYKIISDKKIKVIHLGEAKTLKEFFSKECWRGKSNLKGLKEHGVKMRELPSIVLPLYYMLLPMFFLILLFMADLRFALLLTVFMMLSPPLLIAVYITGKVKKYNYIFKTTTVYLVYFIARAVSMVR